MSTSASSAARDSPRRSSSIARRVAAAHRGSHALAENAVPFSSPSGESAQSERVARAQAKLGVTADEIAKWKFAVVSFGRVEYLEDDEIVRGRFRKQDSAGYANWDDYLGLEHPQVLGAGRKKAAIKSHYDKPIKING